MTIDAPRSDDACVHAGVVARQVLIREALTFLLRRAAVDVVTSVRSFGDLEAVDPEGKLTVAVVAMPDGSGVAIVPAVDGRSWSDPARLAQPVVVLDWDARPRDLVRLVRSPRLLRCPPPGLSLGPAHHGWPGTRVGLSDLTDREIDVLACLADGVPAIEAARRLDISPHTFRTHLGNVMRKLGVCSRLEAVAATRELLEDEIERRRAGV